MLNKIAPSVLLVLLAACVTEPKQEFQEHISPSTLAGTWNATGQWEKLFDCQPPQCSTVYGPEGKIYNRALHKFVGTATYQAAADSIVVQDGDTLRSIHAELPASYVGTDSVWYLEYNGPGKILAQVTSIISRTHLSVSSFARKNPQEVEMRASVRIGVYPPPYLDMHSAGGFTVRDYEPSIISNESTYSDCRGWRLSRPPTRPEGFACR